MKYNLVTTGKGMMLAGIVIGHIEASSQEIAVKKAQELVPGKKMIWDVVLDKDKS